MRYMCMDWITCHYFSGAPNIWLMLLLSDLIWWCELMWVFRAVFLKSLLIWIEIFLKCFFAFCLWTNRMFKGDVWWEGTSTPGGNNLERPYEKWMKLFCSWMSREEEEEEGIGWMERGWDMVKGGWEGWVTWWEEPKLCGLCSKNSEVNLHY